jgi:TolB-like protein/DNA-binding winged helix-turn-helix (wHTH) protein/tetratricopeptide (TPR) repeat protein
LSGTRWSIGRFELDVVGFQLLDRSDPVKLERIPLELLILLVERSGQLVSRDEIASRLWGSGVHVDVESGVNTAVRKLRAALKDSPERPNFIETVPGKGYRFIGPVSKPDPPQVAPETPIRRRSPWYFLGIAVAIAGAIGVIYNAGFRPRGPVVEAVSLTLVVLPFENLSSDPEQDYFSDGLMEETIAALGRVAPSSIRVIARTTSMTYKKTTKTVGQIGSELGASHLIESTVRREGERVRITSKLIRVSDQVQVWADTFDRKPSDLVGVQQEIGSAVARQIGGELSPLQRQSLRKSTDDSLAQDLYLRGRYSLYQRTPQAMQKSVEYFAAAIQKDPSYALAYAGLADTYILQALITSANSSEHGKRMRLAIEKSLTLDPDLAEAHTAAGMASFFVDWNWPAAERSFLRAIELNPSYATARQFYAHLLANSLRHDEAIAEIRRASAVDPFSPMIRTFEGGVLLWARRYGEALAPVQKAIAIDPNFFPARTVLGLLYQQTNKPEAAIKEYREAHRLSGGNILQLANQGFLLGITGRGTEARAILQTMNQIAQTRFVPPTTFALVYAGLGEKDTALQWLERAYEVRDLGLVLLTVDPKWDSLRSDKRFKSLLRRCGFPV